MTEPEDRVTAAEPLSSVAARQIVGQALLSVVPDAALDTIGPEANLREALELDSVDFLIFMTRLAERSGRPIDEDDYDELTTLASCIRFLTRPAPS